MIRISRIIAKNRIADLLDLNYVSKVELKQGRQGLTNPAICRVNIYLQLKDDVSYFHSILSVIREWAMNNKCTVARTTVDCAFRDGFIKESAFNDFDYPMPKKYKDLCDIYSEEYFKLFNHGKI